MKKFLLTLTAAIFMITPAYSQDDDSVPYMPYLEQPQQQAAPKKSAPAKKKAPPKKTTKKTASTKKKTPAKKAAPAPKITSLQRAIALMNEERYEAAKPYLLRAIQENRNDPNAWYWYGVYHEKTGGFHQAQYFYTKAVTIDPAFEPLSRVAYYPNDSEKTPLWDPKRPARVYPVATANNGVSISSQHNYPSSPHDPSLPRVPVYTPPEPGASPIDGDSWSPAVYVPPSPDEIESERYTIEIPTYATALTEYESITVERDEVRADLPLYEPPEPGEVTVAVAPTIKPVSTKSTASRESIKVPVTQPAPRKVVKQSEKKKSVSTPKKSTPAKSTKKAESPAPAPKTPAKRETPMPVVPETPIEETKPEAPAVEYLPPVGQFAPDPGTVPEVMIPPVGQSSN